MEYKEIKEWDLNHIEEHNRVWKQVLFIREEQIEIKDKIKELEKIINDLKVVYSDIKEGQKSLETTIQKRINEIENNISNIIQPTREFEAITLSYNDIITAEIETEILLCDYKTRYSWKYKMDIIRNDLVVNEYVENIVFPKSCIFEWWKPIKVYLKANWLWRATAEYSFDVLIYKIS